MNITQLFIKQIRNINKNSEHSHYVFDNYFENLEENFNLI